MGITDEHTTERASHRDYLWRWPSSWHSSRESSTWQTWISNGLVWRTGFAYSLQYTFQYSSRRYTVEVQLSNPSRSRRSLPRHGLRLVLTHIRVVTENKPYPERVATAGRLPITGTPLNAVFGAVQAFSPLRILQSLSFHKHLEKIAKVE